MDEANNVKPLRRIVGLVDSIGNIPLVGDCSISLMLVLRLLARRRLLRELLD